MVRILLALALAAAAALAQPFKPKLGVEIDGFTDSSRSRPFVDHARLFRPCTLIDGSMRAPVDSDGWPTTDAQCVMFDVRPIPAWAPPIDDPEQFQPDWSGEWTLSLEGRADIAAPGGGATLAGITYDSADNTTRGRITVRPGTGLLILAFRNTRRTASSEANSGFRNLRLIRPGYAARPGQIFTDEFLRSLRPFQTLRYMDFTATNSVTPAAAAERLLEWNERHVPADATQQSWGGKNGVAWEYAVLLANQTGTDMWINVPVSASEDYLRQLARLIVGRLNPGLRIYIEHGNEVWNPLFANSYNFNRNAAAAEVAAGGSNLNNDNQPLAATDTFARRRHLRRVIDAVRVFREAHQELNGGAPDAPGDLDNWRVRGVFAWWTIRPEQYRATLDWGKATFGELNRHLYAIANTHYYNVSRATATDPPERLLEVMRASSDAGVSYDIQYRQLAQEHGIRQAIYEGGPDVGGGSTTNVGNRILANRLPGMKDLMIHDMKTNWWDRGGWEYMAFSQCGACSRYGCWGAVEDIANLDTPKMQALGELSGAMPEPAVTALVNAASFEPRLAPGAFVTIFGTNLANLTHEWNEAIPDGRTLPTMLGGLQVRFNGKPGAMHFVRKDQANVIAPSDLTPGPVEVEVWSANGNWKGSATLQAAAPGLFGYFRETRFYPLALFAGTTTRVAAPGVFSGVPSRPARPGDVIELYATGLGNLADLSSVRVTVGGRPAEMLFAGLTMAGVHQVNVRVPAGISAGDQPLGLEVGTAAAQSAVLPVGT